MLVRLDVDLNSDLPAHKYPACFQFEYNDESEKTISDLRSAMRVANGIARCSSVVASWVHREDEDTWYDVAADGELVKSCEDGASSRFTACQVEVVYDTEDTIHFRAVSEETGFEIFTAWIPVARLKSAALSGMTVLHYDKYSVEVNEC